jgi:hypothetical protein
MEQRSRDAGEKIMERKLFSHEYSEKVIKPQTPLKINM